MMRVSISGASRRLASAMDRSVSKSSMFRTPRTMWWIPSSRQVSTVRLLYWMTLTPSSPLMACRIMSSRSSMVKKPRLSWLIPMAMTTSSNMVRARRRIFRWPAVKGSNDPGNSAFFFIRVANRWVLFPARQAGRLLSRNAGSRRRHPVPAEKDAPPAAHGAGTCR